jgi:CubicO group peptidase (beta-lactamase class C family)
VLALMITINLFIVLTGRFYIYKGVANTYLIGETGPTIYDLDVFPYSTLKAGQADNIPLSPNYNKNKLSVADRAYLENLDTRAFIVIQHDSILHEEYWDAHDENVVSNSFSIAKTIVALLIGIAVEDGDIESLDDPVAKYIPEFKNGGREVITIRHLLTMSSGLDWEESGKNPLSDNAESYYGEELYAHVTRQKLVSTPGKIFKYQSGNSQLLGFIIEKATGKDLTKYAEEKIWRKIGVSHDAYWSLDRKGVDEKAFCCLYATARDFAKLGLVILNEGKYKGKQIFPVWFYHEMIAPTAMDTEDDIKNSRYGLHIWTYTSTMGQVNYCRGISGQYIITIPREDMLIVRIGEKRAKNVEIDPEKRHDGAYIRKIEGRVGHASCLFRYLNIARKMTKNQN